MNTQWLYGNGLAIKRGRVRFHRNGVGGEGFHTVEFSMREGRKLKSFVGIVFFNTHVVAVIDPETPSDTYRGDVFEPLLRRAIEQATESEVHAWNREETA